jgi:hypothetical protein
MDEDTLDGRLIEILERIAGTLESIDSNTAMLADVESRLSVLVSEVRELEGRVRELADGLLTDDVAPEEG